MIIKYERSIGQQVGRKMNELRKCLSFKVDARINGFGNEIFLILSGPDATDLFEILQEEVSEDEILEVSKEEYEALLKCDAQFQAQLESLMSDFAKIIPRIMT